MMRKIALVLFLLAALGSLFTGGCQPAAQGGTLNLYDIDPITLDPAVSGEMTSNNYVMQLFSGLVRLDKDLEPAPDIARSWEVSKDGLTFTFYLRRDVRFHDGRQVTAGDFKYSWERAAAPETGSRTAATYLGDIVGVKEALAGQRRDISGVRVVDDYTLEVTIDAPKSYFLSKLTSPVAFVVDRASVESGDDWWRHPNGSGPFKLKQWDEGSLLVLEKNETYYGKQALVDQVVFHLWAGVPMNMYETGRIDVTGVSREDIDRVTDEAGPFYRDLRIVPELSFFYIGFDHSRPPFDDVNIRRAFSQAIDKDKLVSLVFRDMVQRADGILPPGMPGFNNDLSGLGFDPLRARELIAASRYGSVSALPPITITVDGWGGEISSGLEAIIQEWRQNLGVEVRVRQLEPQRFLYYLKEERDEMFSTGWVADYPHPQNFLEVLFRGGAENNYGDYHNPEVDALLDMAGVETDTGRSLELYRQAERKLVDDAAVIPLWFGQNYTLVKSHVKGYELNPMGYAMLNEVSIQAR
ncbi:MAG: peptide ABC transporter substrate-binding protein [Chloroflexi bacterium]|nr:peptide ABC transporter substrate-binding protein [Chloroflexota bacterium]